MLALRRPKWNVDREPSSPDRTRKNKKRRYPIGYLLFCFPRARDGTRTRDFLLGKEELYQLSHSRIFNFVLFCFVRVVSCRTQIIIYSMFGNLSTTFLIFFIFLILIPLSPLYITNNLISSLFIYANISLNKVTPFQHLRYLDYLRCLELLRHLQLLLMFDSQYSLYVLHIHLLS